MLRARLSHLVEGYRWLWRAQRRWRPSPIPLAVIQFVGRIVADGVWFLLSAVLGGVTMAPEPKNRVRAMGWTAAAGLSVVALLGIAIDRVLEDRSAEPTTVQWTSAAGGFEVVFPGGWVPAPEARASSSTGSAVLAGSSHRLRAGGVIGRRYLEARAYELGEIEAGVTTFRAALSAQTMAGASYHRVLSPSRTGSGAYLAAHRFERSGDALTQVQIVLRGRNSTGFVIEITGARDDEPVLLTQARAIADSIRTDGRVLSDAEVFLNAYLDVSHEAAESARHIQLPGGETSVAGSRLLVAATIDVATSLESCRAATARVWLGVLGTFMVQRFDRRLRSFDLRVSCSGSSIAVLHDLAGNDFFLRQYDAQGTVVYEKDLQPVVYRPQFGRNSIS